MDIKEKVTSIVEKLQKDESLMKDFSKDPVKVVEKLAGVDLPDDAANKIVDGVKAKLAGNKVADAVSGLKKLF